MHAYRTPPQTEFKAEEELREVGISATVPSIRVRVRVGKAIHWRRRPMATGYVIGDLGEHSTYEFKHVRRKVGRVRQEEVDRMVAVIEAEDIIAALRSKGPTFSPGDRCRVTAGPLQGTEVTLIEQRGKVVRVKGFMMNAERELSCHVMQIERLPVKL